MNEYLPYEVLGIGRQVAGQPHIIRQDFAIGLLLGVTLKGRATQQQLACQDAHRPDVCWEPIRYAG